MNRLLRIGMGVFFCSISLVVVIIYVNLLFFNLGFIFFLKSLFKTFEFYLFIPGLYLLKKDRF